MIVAMKKINIMTNNVENYFFSERATLVTEGLSEEVYLRSEERALLNCDQSFYFYVLSNLSDYN